MRKYNLALFFIGVIVVSTICITFTIIGSPAYQQTVRYDEARYNDMQQLNYRIESYYQSNGKLPATLEDLNYAGLNITDPETRKPYTYRISGNRTYLICTNFSTSASEFKKYSSGVYYSFPINHTKGFSCLTFNISNSVNPPIKPY